MMLEELQRRHYSEGYHTTLLRFIEVRLTLPLLARSPGAAAHPNCLQIGRRKAAGEGSHQWHLSAPPKYPFRRYLCLPLDCIENARGTSRARKKCLLPPIQPLVVVPNTSIFSRETLHRRMTEILWTAFGTGRSSVGTGGIAAIESANFVPRSHTMYWSAGKSK